MTAAQRPRGVIGVGYEGHSLETFVRRLLASHVSLVVDVRLNAISRKQGFSKRALSAALAQAGIGYEHVPQLGNPGWNRPGFAGSGAEVRAALTTFGELIAGETASARIDEIAHAAAGSVVAVMCVEADDRSCHRQVILGEVHRRHALPAAIG